MTATLPPAPRRRRRAHAGRGRLTLAQIADLTGLSTTTLHRTLRPTGDVAARRYWQEALDLRLREHGRYGLLHACAERVHARLAELRGEDPPAPMVSEPARSADRVPGAGGTASDAGAARRGRAPGARGAGAPGRPGRATSGAS